ncbi:putative nicotinate-nucleotide adenylyltransferase [Psychromonas marina]|uniref:Probable nicotinate-nucleotide adenylyltransferase n=1 Tax=Psychromonas marina TaxID=88364 RepID=A0ABQ6DVR7_9GAMM|nr:nicotinate-nucleotide adenylyltransferase [Psychromonas marina]GLS89216.1 putative nicotinate-nucleotide adenylyltransferase [Psychromonas marina]
MKPQAIGFLGGSFDPIHNGHLVPALDVAQQLQLQQLFLMPNHIAPHKAGSHCNVEQRTEMVKLAIKQSPQLSIDTRELNRDSASYTVETLKEIQAEYPNTPICFIMGMDSLIHFDSWYQWQDILNYCHLVICARPGWKGEFNATVQALVNSHQTHSMKDLHHQRSGKIYFQKATLLDISSTQIRHNIKHGISIENLLPTLVCDYIKEHQLYK